MKDIMSRASTNVQSRRELEFGISITPYSSSADDIFKIAKTADEVGLEIIGIQDHPYNGSFLDTWTLITALAASTRKIRYFPDVSDLPMRAPAILAKSVATLDILSLTEPFLTSPCCPSLSQWQAPCRASSRRLGRPSCFGFLLLHWRTTWSPGPYRLSSL